jgi:histone H3/H4
MQLSVAFVNHLSSEANDICNEQGRKTITAMNVNEALKVRSTLNSENEFGSLLG